jgi:hypothetical protein
MRKTLILIILLFVNVIFSSYTPVVSYNSAINKHIVTNDSIIANDSILTIENIEKELIKQNILHYDIVLKQVKVETGSLRYVKYNNIFGFRGNHGYLKFETWQQAVVYKKEWQNRNYKGGDYYAFLKRIRYAENPKYIQHLKKMK